MSMVNDYLMFRLLMEESELRKGQRRQSVQQLQQHRGSLFIPRTSISDGAGVEPFCSPIVPHIPIRQRLANRRCTSVDVGDEPPLVGGSYVGSVYGQRRRRMSLLQTLRQQNRQLNDSGLEIHRQRTDSESTNRDTSPPPPNKTPPPHASPSKKTFASNLKSKLFGKREKHRVDGLFNPSEEHSQSCDIIGRARKSPSTTNDSGRGSQPHLDNDRVIGETVAIIERPNDENDEPVKPYRRIRTSSCPDLSSLRISTSPRAPIVDSESEDEAVTGERNSSPITAADTLVERRLMRRAMEAERRQRHHRPQRAQLAMDEETVDEEDEDVHELRELFKQREDDVISRVSAMSRRSNQTEDLADFDDNISTIVLDHYLPLSRSSQINFDEDTLSSEFSLNLAVREEGEQGESSGTASSTVQTDLSLVNIDEELATYLAKLNDGRPISPEGMNFIAKHFFEYQSFVNMPHKAIQLHKTPPSQAGTDPSVGWAPKNMNRAGKNQPAPAARANRLHRDPRPNGTKHGRAAKHEHRDWGDRHGELKEEKVAPHKDAWTKFLSNEDPGQRTVFDSELEDRVLETEEETLPERISRISADDLEFQMAYNASKSSSDADCELLTILTYAPQVQFVTATVKRAKALPYNNSPFARIMLFDGRRLLEQKQTTVNPSVGHKSSLDTSSKPSSSSVSSSLSSSSGDASFSESFLFHVTPSKLDRCHIVIEMFDHDTSGQPLSVGHCVIGRMGDITGHAHWIQMLKKNGLPVCMWHRIGVN
ncbi:hypothetical protein RB195_017144 [Necator americanus]|uniref:C2 domain-containing protein n=1 Tax=Necator americanus TaxID=51031 RepID=A0ABR1C6C2_NECAM